MSLKLPIPEELREQLDHASDAMDEMNVKLDALILLLSEIRDELKKASDS